MSQTQRSILVLNNCNLQLSFFYVTASNNSSKPLRRLMSLVMYFKFHPFQCLPHSSHFHPVSESGCTTLKWATSGAFPQKGQTSAAHTAVGELSMFMAYAINQRFKIGLFWAIIARARRCLVFKYWEWSIVLFKSRYLRILTSEENVWIQKKTSWFCVARVEALFLTRANLRNSEGVQTDSVAITKDKLPIFVHIVELPHHL